MFCKILILYQKPWCDVFIYCETFSTVVNAKDTFGNIESRNQHCSAYKMMSSCMRRINRNVKSTLCESLRDSFTFCSENLFWTSHNTTSRLLKIFYSSFCNYPSIISSRIWFYSISSTIWRSFGPPRFIIWS